MSAKNGQPQQGKMRTFTGPKRVRRRNNKPKGLNANAPAYQPGQGKATKGSSNIPPGPRPWTQQPKTTSLQQSDARLASAVTTEIALSTQLETVALEKDVETNTFFWISAGFITKAIEKGWAAHVDNYSPYYAAVFMQNLLVAYATASTPPAVSVPYWLKELLDAISPKSVPMGHGKVSYKFVVTGGAPTVSTPIGSLSYGNKYSLGYQDTSGSPISGFPVQSLSVPAYSDDLGTAAFQSLCQYMADRATKTSPSRMVTLATQTKYLTDVSAFGVMTQALGTGASGMGGGLYGQLQLEVPIRTPILALAGCSADSFDILDPRRNYNWAVPISGDPITLGVFLSSVLKTHQLPMKRNIRFKQIDFLEFGDVLSRWVTKVTQSAVNQIAATLPPTPGNVLPLICPLTLQEMLLLLRNTFMGAFKQSQAAAQGIIPFNPNIGSENEFVAYVAGTNTAFVSATDMNLPLPLVENIRALVMRELHYKGGSDIQWYCPIVGQYQLDSLSSADYEITYTETDGTVVTVPAFAEGALFERVETNEKGIQVRTPQVEPVISLVDGTSGGNYVCINDAQQLKNLVTMWNNWVKNSGIESFSTKTGVLSTELGINVLCSVAMTRMWLGVQETGTMSKPHPKKRIEIHDKRLDQVKNKAFSSTPYVSRQAIVDLSQGRIWDAPYTQVLQTWILPTCEEEVVPQTSQSTDLPRYQSMFDETKSASRTTGVTGITLSALHDAYAAKMTKGQLATADDWSQFFSECAAQGRGGILSGLVASLVGKAFPGVSGVANAIADALPL